MSNIEPGEQVIVVLDDDNGMQTGFTGGIQAIRPQHDMQMVTLAQNLLSGGTSTYSAVVVGTAIYVIHWDRFVSFIRPFEQNPFWRVSPGPTNFHGSEPPVSVLSGVIYLCGGGFEEAKEYRITGEELLKMNNKCEKFDTNKEVTSWMDIRPMRCMKRLNSVVEANGYIYSIGGIGQKNHQENKKCVEQDPKSELKQAKPEAKESDPFEFQVALSLVERYNPVSDEWQTMPPMNRTRIAPATASYNGKIYVLGGGSGTAENNSSLSADINNRWFRSCVEVFDLNTNVWTMAKKEMTSPRIQFRACVLGDTIYAVGGNKDKHNNAEKANIQDIEGESTDVWSVILEEKLAALKCNYMATVAMIKPVEELQAIPAKQRKLE